MNYDWLDRAARERILAEDLAKAIRIFLGRTYHPEGCGAVLCDALAEYDAIRHPIGATHGEANRG